MMMCKNVLRSLQQVRRLLKVLVRFTNLLLILQQMRMLTKVLKILEDMKQSVVTIRRKDSDKFEGQSKGYIGCFNLDNEFFKRKMSTLEPDLYKNFMKRILKV